jgi:hypothetical protein
LALTFFVASTSTVVLRYFSPSLFGSRQSVYREPGLFSNPANTLNQVLSQSRPARPNYPYSVVPGGVQDVKELKWVAEHDPIVGAHYAGFDYAHAQVVRLTLARTVYVSYRIGNNIYWSRRRIALKKGETLITDGRMTARSRCGNRVDETPHQEAAGPVEPPHLFDEPIKAGEGTAMNSPPINFNSAFANRAETPGTEPPGPLSLYDPFVGGNFVPLSPPPIPLALCGPAKKGQNTQAGGNKKAGPCAVVTPPETVPEPGTWVLFATGLAVIYWQSRRKLART